MFSRHTVSGGMHDSFWALRPATVHSWYYRVVTEALAGLAAVLAPAAAA